MRALTSVERFLERLFERPSARLFHSRLQPIQLQRRIERAMEVERRSSADRTVVPNRFSVHLHPDDLAPLEPFGDRLAAELADGSFAFARAHRYSLVDRPRVDLVSDPDVRAGEIEVVATFAQAHDDDVARADGQSTDRAFSGLGGNLTDTRVFSVPRIVSPSAILREIRSDGTQRAINLDGSLLTIGRGPDNMLIVPDRGVSRRHARIQARHGSLVLSDLGSTNGTRVNGVRVDELVLGEGDRIEIGSTVLVVERVPGLDSRPDPPPI
jgi:hypothetical protein